MRTRRFGWVDGAPLLALTSGCLLALSACSDQPASIDIEEPGSTSDGVIIGTNDLVKVQPAGANLDARYRPLVNAFGRLKMGSGYCTATHLGNGVAISAGHCWEAGATRQNNVSCAGSSVEWGYTSGGTASTSTCSTILAMQQSSGTNKLDYAIFKVSPIPPDSVPVDWSGKAPTGATLTIFSHPQARPQEWSKTCAVQSPTTTQFTYQCDTEAGSSGATVLNDTSLKVTGVHWGGATSGNSATYILSTPIGEFLPQGDGGGTGGTGGADGGGTDGGKGGADGSSSDATSDAPKDGAADGPDGMGTGGAAGAAGASGAGGTAGSGTAGSAGAGTAGSGGSAGKAGAAGAGGSGTAGSGGAGGKAGASGAGGATGGSGGSTGGAAGSGTSGSGGAGGSSGGAAGSGTAGSGTGGKGGTGGSSAGTGGSGTSDDSGCSCRIGSESTSSNSGRSGGVLAALGLGIAGTLRRSRRKSSRS